MTFNDVYLKNMAHIARTISTAIAIMAVVLSAAAQGSLQTANIRAEGISKAKSDTLVGLFAAAWAAYTSDASLINHRTREVDDESIDAFKRHFSFNAKVLNDLVEFPVQVHYSDYVSQVFRRLKKEGVRGWFEEASLTRISYDQAGYYRGEIKVSKRVLNRIGGNGQETAAERCFDMVYKFELPNDLTGAATISSIEGAACASKGKGKKNAASLALLGQANFNSFGFDRADHRLQDSSVHIAGNAGWAAGLYLRTSLWAGSQVDLGIGAMFSSLELKSEAQNVFLEKNSSRLDSLAESVRLSYLDLPLGLHFRVLDKEKVMLSADAIGTTHLLAKSTSNKRFYKLSGGKGTEVDIAAPDYWAWFSLGLGLTARYAFAENWGLELGAQYAFGLTPLLGHHSKSDFFLDDTKSLDEPDISFSESYLKNIRANYGSIRLGLFYNL
jgi:hypothetical protein